MGISFRLEPQYLKPGRSPPAYPGGPSHISLNLHRSRYSAAGGGVGSAGAATDPSAHARLLLAFTLVLGWTQLRPIGGGGKPRPGTLSLPTARSIIPACMTCALEYRSPCEKLPQQAAASLCV